MAFKCYELSVGIGVKAYNMNGHFILTKPGRLNKSLYKNITKKRKFALVFMSLFHEVHNANVKRIFFVPHKAYPA